METVLSEERSISSSLTDRRVLRPPASPLHVLPSTASSTIQVNTDVWSFLDYVEDIICLVVLFAPAL